MWASARRDSICYENARERLFVGFPLLRKLKERLFAGFPARRHSIFALPNASVVVYDARDGNIPLLKLNAALMKA